MTKPYHAGPYARQLMHCPIFHTDFYKIGHKDMEPDGTTFVQANLTPRFSKYLEEKLEDHFDGTVIVAGVQPYVIELRDRWQLNFFDIPWAVLESAIYEHICLGLFNPNLSIEHMRQLHALQHLPVRIRALLDGTHSKVQVPIVTFENTHPDFEWLPTYLETDSSNHIWPSTTAATLVYHTKQIVKGYFERTGTDFAMYDWLLHDFSARGMMGTSATRLTGVPHLFVSYGTDTVATLPALHYYYGATNHEGLTGHSVRASEHSVTCMYGENDIETFRGWLRKFIDGVMSLVSDTHDYWHMLTYGMETLHDDILARNGKVVIRPDSGDPYRILVGYPEFDYSDQVDKANLMLPEWIANASFKGQAVVDNNAYNRAILDGTVETLAQRFGTTTNHAGYKTLMSKIGVIYGDGMSPGRIAMILEGLMERGYTADNVIFGLGSYFYQGNTRDSLGIAVKVTYCIVNGQARSVFKAPKTDDGFKRSAKGLLTVKDGALVELHDVNPDDVVLGLYDAGDLLTVFDNSVLYNQSTLKEVRQRVGALVL